MDAPGAVDLKRAYRTTPIIGVAMIGSLAVYAVVVEILRAVNAPFRGFVPFAGAQVLRCLFLALSVAHFFLIGFVRDRMLSGPLKVPPAAAVPVWSAQIQRLSAAAIVSFALCESVAIYGLLLFLIAGSRSDFYGFLLLSLVLHAIYFPRYGQWEEWMRSLASE